MKWGSLFLLAGLLALWAGLPPASGHVTPVFCRLPPDSGPCEALGYFYYYNPAVGTCLTFAYGGCGGNRNRFSTKQECLRVCGRKKGQPQE